MVDYLASRRATPTIAAAIGDGPGRGAELAGIEIVGGELAQLGEIDQRARPRWRLLPGLVALDSLVTGAPRSSLATR